MHFLCRLLVLSSHWPASMFLPKVLSQCCSSGWISITYNYSKPESNVTLSQLNQRASPQHAWCLEQFTLAEHLITNSWLANRIWTLQSRSCFCFSCTVPINPTQHKLSAVLKPWTVLPWSHVYMFSIIWMHWANHLEQQHKHTGDTAKQLVPFIWFEPQKANLSSVSRTLLQGGKQHGFLRRLDSERLSSSLLHRVGGNSWFSECFQRFISKAVHDFFPSRISEQ